MSRSLAHVVCSFILGSVFIFTTNRMTKLHNTYIHLYLAQTSSQILIFVYLIDSLPRFLTFVLKKCRGLPGSHDKRMRKQQGWAMYICIECKEVDTSFGLFIRSECLCPVELYWVLHISIAKLSSLIASLSGRY